MSARRVRRNLAMVADPGRCPGRHAEVSGGRRADWCSHSRRAGHPSGASGVSSPSGAMSAAPGRHMLAPPRSSRRSRPSDPGDSDSARLSDAARAPRASHPTRAARAIHRRLADREGTESTPPPHANHRTHRSRHVADRRRANAHRPARGGATGRVPGRLIRGIRARDRSVVAACRTSPHRRRHRHPAGQTSARPASGAGASQAGAAVAAVAAADRAAGCSTAASGRHHQGCSDLRRDCPTRHPTRPLVERRMPGIPPCRAARWRHIANTA